MPFEVLLTQDAADDLAELHRYVARHDDPARADDLIDRLGEVLQSLAEMPERGSWPRELLALGIQEFREVFYKPYRAIYRAQGQKVHILLIADGRRDLQLLFQRRLLRRQPGG